MKRDNLLQIEDAKKQFQKVMVHITEHVKLFSDPSLTRAIVIGALIFIENLLVPTSLHLQGGTEPDLFDLTTYLVSALLVEITYWLAYLGYSKSETKSTVVESTDTS